MRILKLLIPIVLLLLPSAVSAQTSAITYQGKLTQNNIAANGLFDFKFKLFADASDTAQIGSDSLADDKQVTNGIFTVELDFSLAPFINVSGKYIEIYVRDGASSGAYTLLTPRQKITSAPYAVKAIDSDSLGGIPAENYAKLSDITPSGSYIDNGTAPQSANFNITGTGTIGGQLTAANANITGSTSIGGNLAVTGTITGSGSGITNLNPANISTGTAKIAVANEGTATAGTTPSVANLTTLKLNYAAATTLTDLAGGVDGQCVTLIAGNTNAILTSNAAFWVNLAWNPDEGDTLTVCKSGTRWIEKARAANSQRPLTVNLTNNLGSGKVTSLTSNGINCPSDCSEIYVRGTTVTLTVPDVPDQQVKSWSGGGCSGTGNTCVVTLNSPTTVTVEFEKRKYWVWVAKYSIDDQLTDDPEHPSPLGHIVPDQEQAGQGSITVDAGVTCENPNPTSIYCGYRVPWGTRLTFTYTDVNEPIDGGGVTTSTILNTGVASQVVAFPYTYIVPLRDTSLTWKVQFGKSISVTKYGNGTVTSTDNSINCGTDCSEYWQGNNGVLTGAPTVPGPSSITLNAVPGINSLFKNWSGGACNGSTNPTCVINPFDRTTNVVATFEPTNASLRVTKEGPGNVVGGGINCGSTCTSNESFNSTVTLTATPSAPSGSIIPVFAGWTGMFGDTTCDSITTSNQCTLTMDRFRWVKATFVLGRTISVEKTGKNSNAASVTSENIYGARINCGSTCSASFPQTSAVTLTAPRNAPSPIGAQYTFNHWEDVVRETPSGCAGSTDNVCTIPAGSTNLQVRAVYNP